ncbi:MAG: hypothetical protein ACO3NK_13480 [Prochlorotrichaceae cyanobacterium]|jgi:hypothetical protein
MTRQLFFYFLLTSTLTLGIAAVASADTGLSFSDSDRLPMLMQDDHEGLPGGRIGGGTR